MRHADHARQLPRREHHVHIMPCVLLIKELHIALALFRHARHDGHCHHILRNDADLFGKISLHHRAEHLLGRFCRRKPRHQMRILWFHKTHPPRTAWCEHRHLPRVALLETLHKLTALLHDREIGGKYSVKHIVKPDLLQRIGNLPHRGFLAGKSKRFSPRGADCGRHLHDSDLLPVLDRPPRLLRVIALPERAYRAVCDALSAQGAVRLLDLPVSGHVHTGARSRPFHVPHADALHFVTDGNTAHALDTFVIVTDQREILVPQERHQLFPVWHLENVQIPGDRLKGAVSVPGAGHTVAVMLWEDHLNGLLAVPADFGTVGIDDHAILHLVVAGGDKLLPALDLHDTHTAGADLIDIF